MARKQNSTAHHTATSTLQKAMLVRAARNRRTVLYNSTEMYVVRQDGDNFTLSTSQGSRKKRTRRNTARNANAKTRQDQILHESDFAVAIKDGKAKRERNVCIER